MPNISTYTHAFNVQIIYHIISCIFNATIHFMRFKHIHKKKKSHYTCQCWLFHLDYSIHTFWRIPFDESRPYYHSVMCLYIYNSISHHDGCCLVHPDTWYHLFGLPSCRIPFGASRHVVSIIRSPIMSDAVWGIPTRGIN